MGKRNNRQRKKHKKINFQTDHSSILLTDISVIIDGKTLWAPIVANVGESNKFKLIPDGDRNKLYLNHTHRGEFDFTLNDINYVAEFLITIGGKINIKKTEVTVTPGSEFLLLSVSCSAYDHLSLVAAQDHAWQLLSNAQLSEYRLVYSNTSM